MCLTRRPVPEVEPLAPGLVRGRVLEMTCDITQAQSVRLFLLRLRKVLTQAQPSRQLRVVSVLHTAGCTADAPYHQQRPELLDQVLKPKVAGLRTLLEELKGAGYACDSAMLFSSSSAVLGSPGQMNYAVANALADSVAREFVPTTHTIHFGPWDPAIGGMTSELSLSNRARMERHGIGFLSRSQGQLVLSTLWACESVSDATVAGPSLSKSVCSLCLVSCSTSSGDARTWANTKGGTGEEAAARHTTHE